MLHRASLDRKELQKQERHLPAKHAKGREKEVIAGTLSAVASQREACYLLWRHFACLAGHTSIDVDEFVHGEEGLAEVG
jgi:hypothetical protein